MTKNSEQFHLGQTLNNLMEDSPEKNNDRPFPGGAVVGNPPASAGDTGLSPGPGGSHMPRSNWARAPQLPSLRSRARAPRARAQQQEKPLQ